MRSNFKEDLIYRNQGADGRKEGATCLAFSNRYWFFIVVLYVGVLVWYPCFHYHRSMQRVYTRI